LLDHRADAVLALRRIQRNRSPRAPARNLFASIEMNHCGVLRKISGAFDRQECG
jgi:hypothetical protein